jgi:thiamine biosynthesis lipoprotein
MSAQRERTLGFPSCGGRATVHVSGDAVAADAAAARVREMLGLWESSLTRFDPASELSDLNARRAGHVRVSDLLADFVAAAIGAARRTNGLVDPTLIGQIEAAGYRGDLTRPLPLELTLLMAPPRRAARPDPLARWTHVSIDRPRRVVKRPHGVGLDSGGIAKGLFADMAAATLEGFDSYAIDCCGNVRIGGRGGRPRRVDVADPFRRGTIHALHVAGGAVATSGIGRKSWIGPGGTVAHHLLDPSTGRPAFTGIVQATAIAPTGVEAETLAKAALLEGPAGARRWLPYGGVLVFDDGTHDVVAAADSAGAIAA